MNQVFVDSWPHLSTPLVCFKVEIIQCWLFSKNLWVKFFCSSKKNTAQSTCRPISSVLWAACSWKLLYLQTLVHKFIVTSYWQFRDVCSPMDLPLLTSTILLKIILSERWSLSMFFQIFHFLLTPRWHFTTVSDSFDSLLMYCLTFPHVKCNKNQ